ncbi:LXG domain-containing protein [Rossellomorea marisflavi]|uniref:LXG domain-containing protein n=1 Tax=Rossellomorea marisflavi TaxID=189381 RepID=UPI0025AF8FB2|nr:LXG domain-containing protein [Rossellomorea marisflavi]WJV19922.1 LXG domain-containing protein [Rossellomorea marisflavi]
MKTFDNKALNNGIQELQSQLTSQKNQLTNIYKAIQLFSESQDAFSGNGADAIRSFYQDVHIPFLTFYSLSLINFEKVLTSLKTASTQFEPDTSGFIHQPFLDNEIKNDLYKIENHTLDMIDETNRTLNSIKDIVNIPSIPEQDFLGAIKQAEHKVTQTLENLTSFDTNQTKALDTVDHDIQLMKRYIYEIEGMFKNGKIEVENYSGTELNSSFHHRPFMSKLESRLGYENLIASSLTTSSEYDSLRQLYLLGKETFGSFSSPNSEDLAVSNEGEAQTFSGVCYPPTKNQYVIDKHIEDGFGSDGVGNAGLNLVNDFEERKLTLDLEGSIVNSNYMDDMPSALQQKFIYGEVDVDLPYSFQSAGEALLYGQNFGVKMDGAISKTTISHEKSPASLDVEFGKAEAKANIENYTASAGIGVSAADFELKIEPLNFFGYEPLEEWFGIEYDPYIAVDFSLGSAGINGSVGLETGIYAAYGLGVGIKGGLEKDE